MYTTLDLGYTKLDIIPSAYYATPFAYTLDNKGTQNVICTYIANEPLADEADLDYLLDF